jgi:hypothetical protein
MSLGDNLSDFVSSQLGTWKFVSILTAITAVWIGWNTHADKNKRFDPYPFVALNLCYSFIAGYTAPILLMSATRQAELDRRRAIENLEIDRMDHVHIDNMLHKIRAIEEDIQEAVAHKQEPSDANPDWVCTECGKKWGLWWLDGVYSGPTPHFATYHVGGCNVCSKPDLIVTEARDYGYLRKGWNRK